MPLLQALWSKQVEAGYKYESGEKLTAKACGIRMKAHDKVAENCRRLSQMCQFRIEPILLLQAALAGGGSAAHAVWCSLHIQRYIHRELRIYDSAIEGVGMHYSKLKHRWALPPIVGVSRVLDDVDERAVDGDDGDDDGTGEAGEDGAGGKGKGKGKQAGGRNTGVQKNAKATTLAEAVDMDEDQEEDEEEEEDGVGRGPEDELPRPTSASPYWSTVYGQYMLGNSSYHAALCE